MSFRVALCQFGMAWENEVNNFAKISSLIGQKKEEYDWIIFPEMCLSGFSMNLEKTTISQIGLDFFADIARNKNCFVSFGAVTSKENKLITINTDGKIVSEYSKQHLFSLGSENKNYRPGLVNCPFTMNEFEILPAICYDLRFSYVFWQFAEKCDVYVVIASWPASRAHHWRTLLQARAIENQAYVIGVNRIGIDPNLSYSGDSVIVDPQGNIIVDALSQEGLFIGEINKQYLIETRKKFPFLQDRLS